MLLSVRNLGPEGPVESQQGRTSTPSLSWRNWVLGVEGASHCASTELGKGMQNTGIQCSRHTEKFPRFSLKKPLRSWQYFSTTCHLMPKIVLQARNGNRHVAQQHSNYLTWSPVLISSATERKKICVCVGDDVVRNLKTTTTTKPTQLSREPGCWYALCMTLAVRSRRIWSLIPAWGT